MTQLTGLPDLGRPLDTLPGAAYQARDRLGLGVLLPSVLTLEPLPEGGVALLVTLLREGLKASGRIEAGFAVGTPLTEAGEAAATNGTPLLLSAAEPLRGVLEVSARFGTPGAALAPPVALGPDTLTTTRVVAELPADAAVLAARLVRDGTVPVDAALRLTFQAVAPTLPLRATVDPQALLATLTQRFGPGAAVPFDRLATALDEAVFGAPSQPDRAAALALRLRPAVSRPEPVARPLHRLLEQVPAAALTLDLADPTAVDVDQALTLDLDAAARALAASDPAHHVREVDAPAPPTGRTTVTFAANLPAPVAGLALLLADLRVPPSATRPQEVTASVPLTAPGGVTSTTITLAPGERLKGEVRLRAVLDGTGELEGPWRPAHTTLLTLAPDAFPVPLTVVRATRALTALAVAEVRTAGGTTLGRVDAAGPVLAVPVTANAPPATITVQPLGLGQPVQVPVDRRRIELDPATLPGFGTHLARLRHAPVSGPLTVQWRPEGGEAEPQTVRLDADRPQADIRWTATSPFQPGVLWRVGPADWSAPVAPRDFLVIDVDPPILVDGVELRPDPDRPGSWTYVPPGPFLDHPNAISLIDAGPASFLQVTSRIDLPDGRRDAIRRGLGGGIDIHPAEVRVTRVAVETKSPDGVWTAVAEGTSSGIPPWTTALSASLDGDRRTAARAALGGTAGWMALVAELTVAGRPVRRTRDIAALIDTPHD
ncbi:hypothetical protein ACIG3E_23180 [Streptomyces sp. NPDC053474]|uniref:hypothetical protein n=1 Tax=Streptomyces sp. NPDC053474 TaxID=3365704 RepID=UPI0037CDB41C